LTGPKDVEAVASDLGFDGGRRRAVEWTLAHDPRSVESLITLTELLVLGGGRPADLNAWGMSMLSAMGCLCSRLTPPGAWLTLSAASRSRIMWPPQPQRDRWCRTMRHSDAVGARRRRAPTLNELDNQTLSRRFVFSCLLTLFAIVTPAQTPSDAQLTILSPGD